MFACAVAALILTSLLIHGPLGWKVPPHLYHFLLAQSALFLVSGAMALVCWRKMFSPGAIVRLGLLYQITGGVIISICAFQGEMLLQPTMVQLSWLAVWIVLFPLFVPAPPLESLAVSVVCATSAPVVFLTWVLFEGRDLPAVPILAATFVPYYVCAGLAVLPAWLVYDLGASATRAREVARELGSYRLVELLGQGGMGEVWRAEHGMLARSAAIKLVRNQRAEPSELDSVADARERFAREAKATAALTSPHTVSLYDYGVTADGTLYYAMELLQGVNLECLVERFGPVSPARAIYLLRQVCESLEEAHCAGLVHRDIKPANIMACQLGGRVDFVKVLDFGLVRSFMAPEQDALVTDADHVLGTPAFMAPELATKPDQVDGRADLYALGCLAYWLVTGRLVFEQPTVAAVIGDHIFAKPLPPQEKASQAIPGALEDLILECLAKQPQDRPGSAKEVHRRLGEIRVLVPWGQQRAHAWWRARMKDLMAPDPQQSSVTTKAHELKA